MSKEKKRPVKKNPELDEDGVPWSKPILSTEYVKLRRPKGLPKTQKRAQSTFG